MKFSATQLKNQTSGFLLNASKANHTVFSTGLAGVRISVATVATWLSSTLYFYQSKVLFFSLSSNSLKSALWKNLGHFKWHLCYWKIRDHISQGLDVGCQTNTQQKEISTGCILCMLLNTYSVADKAKCVPARCKFPSNLCWQAVLSVQSCRKATASIWSCCSYRDLTALLEGEEMSSARTSFFSRVKSMIHAKIMHRI